MRPRHLDNLLKRKVYFFFRKFFSAKKVERETNEWAKNQLKELSKFGGELIVMKMGS